MGDEYPKINTVWARDTRGKILPGQYSCPEFEFLATVPWTWTEKVDGTNIRIHYDGTNGLRDRPVHYIAGRTDNAQIPPRLLQRLTDITSSAPFAEVFGDSDLTKTVDVTLYGEGYGANIQRGGGNYIPDGCDFVLFDVKIGSWWITRPGVEEMGAELGIPVVPIIGQGPLQEAVDLVEKGFPSQRWPGVKAAEGLVCRPAVELFDRGGRRILTKVKHKDFR